MPSARGVLRRLCIALQLEQLDVARRALERTQARLRAPLRRAGHAQARGGHPCQAAQEPSEEEFGRLVLALIGACDITVPQP